MQAPSILYKRRKKPKPPPVIPEGDYQDRKRNSIDSSNSEPVQVEGEQGVLETTRDIPNTQRSLPNLDVSGRCEKGCSGIACGGCEDSNSNTSPRSNHESHFVQDQTRYLGDSTLLSDSASSNSISDDDRSSRSGRDLNTGINLRRSYKMLSKDENVFQCDVHVWQNGLPPSPKFPDQLKFITLLFDTQCQGSNWVAAKIVENLGAKVQRLSYQAEFIGFNGQPMATFQKTTLWFKKSCGGSTWRADFLVSPVKKVPFDMLLGARDCLKFNIIEPPTLLGLAGPKQSKYDKEEEVARVAQHANDAEEHERKIRKLKDKKQAKNRRMVKRTRAVDRHDGRPG